MNITDCRAQRWRVLDAFRVSDGTRVMLRSSKPMRMFLYWITYTLPSLRVDQRNHTVPILDKIPVPGEENRVWIVMPYLLMFQAFVHTIQILSVRSSNASGNFLRYDLSFMHGRSNLNTT